MRSCHRFQRRICTEKEKDIFIIKNRKRESIRVYKKSVKTEVY